jgi:probable blue pigment (indigoidine) exporter
VGGRAVDPDRRDLSNLTNRLGRGEIFAALAASAYGSSYVATAFALRSFEPLAAAVYRSLLAALALAVIVWFGRRRGRTSAAAERGPARPRARLVARLGILGALGGAIFLVGMNLAVAGVGPTITSFVAGLYAVLAAVIAPFILQESLRPRALVGFVVALAGTALLAELDVNAHGVAGIGWGLLAAGSFALFLVLSRKWGREEGLDGLVIALATMSVAAVVLGPVVFATRPASLVPGAIAPEALVAMAWLVVTAAGGQALAAASVKLIPASRSAAFLLLNPIVATILSFFLLGERPSGVQLLGGVLVLLGIAAATIDPTAFRRPALQTRTGS